jgi:hypothetical protein
VMGGPAARLRVVIKHYRDMVTNSLASSEKFRDDLHAWLRGMAICLDMVANGSTHSEKNARLRGAIEVTEQTIQKVIDQRFNFDNLYWRWQDTFKSDFPTREILRRKNELLLPTSTFRARATRNICES